MSTLARPTPVYVASPRRPTAADLLRQTVREVAAHSDLVRQLARATMRRAGAHTILGNVWWVLDPLLQMPLYVLLVGVILRSGTPDFPLFLFSAILPWKWFTSSLSEATSSVATRDQLIKQVAFPKIALPISAIVAVVPQFLFGLAPLLLMMGLFYRHRLSAFILLVPVVAAVQLVLSLAIGILLAICNAFARDTGRLTGFVFRIWFILSPALYSSDRIEHVSGRYPMLGIAFRLNPFTTLFESYRAVIYEGTFPSFIALVAVLLVSLGLLATTSIFFKRLEPSLAKIL
ncbi:MAG TPA: ABC transporter permease [Candidatus Methylomirabilis sp.]|nr:ABC transporter permease [Candidatus Methylomirabilis sp.]